MCQTSKFVNFLEISVNFQSYCFTQEICKFPKIFRKFSNFLKYRGSFLTDLLNRKNAFSEFVKPSSIYFSKVLVAVLPKKTSTSSPQDIADLTFITHDWNQPTIIFPITIPHRPTCMFSAFNETRCLPYSSV